MTLQSEQTLENNLVEQLVGLGYESVTLRDEADLLLNLKQQLEKHNEITLTDNEFSKVLNHLNKGNVFDRAKILRDKMQLTRDDGQSIYIEFLQLDHWCQNKYQVTQQVTVEGKYKNRYDVTILVNGLPLVQVELKRRGLEIKEAFNQVNRYQRHSFWSAHGLFQYVQVFVISNGVNTKYYANNRKQSFKQTFYWSDEENRLITQLEQFAEVFLEPCHISKMITQYIVLNETHKILMVLRPYQYYATEAIIERVKTSRKNGYIWHTTGSGKTLTAFKTSQILMRLPKVHKVVFVVDRKDLDYQTIREFNSFSPGSVDATTNTKALVNQFTGDTQLIVTTLQKLNTAIGKAWFKQRMESHRNERTIFIFDECHRSQFGDTHARIISFFTNAQLFGFTGTPIFAENAVKNVLGKRTTKDLFDECLHKYVITDAIKDENVLKFLVEYIGKKKDEKSSRTNVDIESDGSKPSDILNAPNRADKVVNYILQDIGKKTHGKTFNAIFAVNSVKSLLQYYDLFKELKEQGKHNLNIATIFSYTANEEDKDATGEIADELPNGDDGAGEPLSDHPHTRDKLEQYIEDYNSMFGTSFTTKEANSFYNYYNDISKKVRNRKVDLLLVVNMFLTGFDSPNTNTLYVDKNLRYHGLIQSFSRTNRVLNEQKSHGNIVCFRDLKSETDDAVALFSNKDAKEIIFDKPYSHYKEQLNSSIKDLYEITPTVDSVNDLMSEPEKAKFVLAFRDIVRTLNKISAHADFSWDDLEMDEQSFNDYKSKYLDLRGEGDGGTGGDGEGETLISDIDFELELIRQDEINVAYILALLAKMVDIDPKEREKHKQEIVKLLAGDVTLRPKKELIEKFMNEVVPEIDDVDDIPTRFDEFWGEQQQKAIDSLAYEEGLVPEKLNKVLQDVGFTNREPLRQQVVDMRENPPRLMERKTVVERLQQKLRDFVEVFVNHI